ncbi:glycerophosphodiester phosphodiesterase family protein [Streptomyces sp. NBC_00878]|uniref:glycerophosphodiester phosphodiesterase family protein n=1 Tax=Streptomyces sp. NBC_00878 TaxID=2975854 RepID=UPI0022542C84|nr:glycerophosphodiester phosphodiesterase family protein [Streptomyces sp. NBC_00878]MCX4904307.1 glycerophosphodiester phosphodiesterase family protein [Streptomyces sp. NBC_00878]
MTRLVFGRSVHLATALALALTLTGAVVGAGLSNGEDPAKIDLIADQGASTARGGSDDSYVFGGRGQGGRTPAERAYRDLLDHSGNAKILTVAHRGQWRYAPENSMPAIRAAFEQGAEIAEIDVRLTKDGVPVLMHDESVDRTTNGSGRIADLTFAQIKDLRLKEGLGGNQASVTDERIPTLEETMTFVKDRGLVNLDKGWPFREEIWKILTKTGTVRNGLYKSNAPVEEVKDFLDTHKGAVYMHMIGDANLSHFTQFGDDQPVAYEVNFASIAEASARKPFLDAVAKRSRVWSNTMWNGLADRMTDEASLVDPLRGWEGLVRGFNTSIFQTDDVEKLESWLRTGEGDPLPRGAVRVQAEDFRPGEGVGYHDNDAANVGDLPMRPGEGVDISDADGNVRVSWMRGGEWLSYEMAVPRTGIYAVSARVSSPYSPAGHYTLSFDGGPQSKRVAVLNTTSHNKEVLQPSGVTQRLTAGRHTVRVSLPADVYQNWNLDYLQFDLVRR